MEYWTVLTYDPNSDPDSYSYSDSVYDIDIYTVDLVSNNKELVLDFEDVIVYNMNMLISAITYYPYYNYNVEHRSEKDDKSQISWGLFGELYITDYQFKFKMEFELEN